MMRDTMSRRCMGVVLYTRPVRSYIQDTYILLLYRLLITNNCFLLKVNKVKRAWRGIILSTVLSIIQMARSILIVMEKNQ